LYEIIAKGGIQVALAIILIYLLTNYISDKNKERDEYEKLVEDVRKESKEREDKLMAQLDKCTSSLQEISENIKVIPQMQEEIKVIPSIKADIEYLKGQVSR